MINQIAPSPAPVRVHSLDVVRGLAVLGILAVNAISLAAPLWYDPTAPESLLPIQGGDAFARWIVDVFFTQKFVTLFSMLFGVSIFLVGSEKGSVGPSRLLKRRLFWLGLIGLIHGTLFWYGDILLSYALVGAIAMNLRSWPAQKLLKIGGAGILLFATISALLSLFLPSSQTVETTPDFMNAALSLSAYEAGWPSGLWENLKAWLFAFPTGLFLYGPLTFFLMLTGLGLFKSGYFHGRWPLRIYLRLIALGTACLILLGYLSWPDAQGGPRFEAAFNALSSFAIFISLAYASALILAISHQAWVRRLLAPVGQMAFTNYLTQTLIMGTLFYLPWGPHLMGRVGETSLWLFVLAIWGLQLVWSPLWLKSYRMGPLEWVWRCLTHGQRQPLRRA